MTKLCIISGNYTEAAAWASAQNLESQDWFFPDDLEDLRNRTNFHVIVVGTAGENVPSSYFEKVYQLALRQGRMNRK